MVTATIVEAKSKKIFGRKGQLSLRFDHIKAFNDNQISLRFGSGKILKINQLVQTG